ncbi:MAG: HAT repeat-containing protein, partial [archaeon]|nr:HAT repeat-containing protein [archaeon]
TFSRLWVMAAEFELRQKNLPAARRLLGSALGYRPSFGVFEAYIAIERQLGQFDRCRSLCEKMLQRFPLHSRAWRFFAAFESALQEPMRARALFELALERSQQLDSPELVWRDFLAFELKQGNQPAVRSIYERLLAQLPSVQVWLNYASFEAFAQQPERARAIYRRCWELLQKVSSGFPSERSSLLDAWMVFERQHGDGQSQASVDALIQQQQQQPSLQVVAAASSDSPSALPTIAVISSQLSLAERARRWKEQRNANLSTNQ